MGRGIERISLRHFRGATTSTDLIIDSKKRVVMIFGENGTGKSTIVDAIDLVCNQSAGSLAERSSTNPKQHLPSIGRQPREISVEITCAGQTWTGSHSGSKIIVRGPEQAPAAHILRRPQLLRLIETAPADRYKELRRFIDVAGVERSEQALGDAERAAKRRLEEAIRLRQEAEDSLAELWSAEGMPGGHGATALDWAEQKAGLDTTATREVVVYLDRLLRAMDRAETARAAFSEARRKRESSQAELVSATAEIASYAQASGTIGADLLGLLKQVQAYLAPPHDAGTCPVCRQTVDLEALRRDVAARIASAGALTGLSERQTVAGQALDGAVAVHEEARGQLMAAARALAAEATDPDFDEVSSLSIDWSRYTLLLSPEDDRGEQGVAQAEALLALLSSIQTALEECREKAQTDIGQHTAILQLYERLRDGDDRIKEAEAVHERLKRALEIVRAKRIAFTQSILDTVSGECTRLYQRIHPDEPLGIARFRLDENRRASLHQEAHFQGHTDVPPQAYFSESHLDTLGFCLFLALARLYSSGNAVVVLDDVFTSADQAHLQRILDLLTEESQTFNQIILTTHYRQWRDRYQYLAGPASNIELIELSTWTRSRGIRPHRTQPAVEDLAQKLAGVPFDRQAVGVPAGILLEAALDHLTLLYRCRVPRRQDGEYTLGDLCGAAARLGEHLVIRRPVRDERGNEKVPRETEEIPIEPLLQAVGGMPFIRNQVGRRFDAGGAGLCDDEVRSLGEATVKLVSALVCPGCGELPRRPNVTHFTCACGQTQMLLQKSDS